jgi:Uma2 family endonuclease
VPDVCAYLTDPHEDVLTVVPLLVAEVLSPEDCLTQVAREAKEYLAMGVPVVWILDPVDKVAYVMEPDKGLFQVGKSISTFDGSYSLQLADIFSEEGQ